MESVQPKRSSFIAGLIVGIAIVLTFALVIFTAMSNANKGSSGNGKATTDDPEVVGDYKAYASLDSEGKVITDEIERLKNELGMEMYATFKADGTGTLSRKSEIDGDLTLPFTYEKGTMHVKENDDLSYDGSYYMSENKNEVAIVDDSGSVIIFARIKEEEK